MSDIKITTVVVLLRTEEGRTVQAILDRPVQRRVLEEMRYHTEGPLKVTDVDSSLSIVDEEGIPLTKADKCGCSMCLLNRKYLGNNA